jgi:hypothetical protein
MGSEAPGRSVEASKAGQLAKPPFLLGTFPKIPALEIFAREVSRMPDSRRPWSEDDIAKLKSMAGRFPAREIAAELGRSPGAVWVEASKLKIPLGRRSGTPRPASRIQQSA